MSIIQYTKKEAELLARLMRAEAESEGELGMLMVGNVGVNRVLANCLDFKEIHSIESMVYQHPGGFESTLYSYFYQPVREIDLNLAKRVLKGEKFDPASQLYGFIMLHKMIVWHNGGVSGTLGVIKHIVFTHQ
ncbi:MAG: cell wall hydrolase [Bacilli bacterium]